MTLLDRAGFKTRGARSHDRLNPTSDPGVRDGVLNPTQGGKRELNKMGSSEEEKT